MPNSENLEPKRLHRRAKRQRRSPRVPCGETPGELRQLIEQRDRLYEEAQHDPESEAADLARTFIFTGMLAGQRGAKAYSEVARLERTVRDQKTQLDQIAQAARQAQEQKLNSRDLCRRIAQAVGLIPSSQAEYDQVFRAAAAPREEVQTCEAQYSTQTQNSPQAPFPARNS